MNKQYDLNIKVRDDGVYVLETEIYNFHLDEKTHVEKMGRLINENEQLKQRNDRQAKQLDKLYRLIEEKDWIALSDIINDFKLCEEQLQKEWGTYCEFE